jgi:hypothetical protein
MVKTDFLRHLSEDAISVQVSDEITFFDKKESVSSSDDLLNVIRSRRRCCPVHSQIVSALPNERMDVSQKRSFLGFVKVKYIA